VLIDLPDLPPMSAGEPGDESACRAVAMRLRRHRGRLRQLPLIAERVLAVLPAAA